MIVIGAFEARARLSALLDRVESGDEVVITRHGRPVARLVPTNRVDEDGATETVEQLKALRKGATLGGLSWKAFRDEGRR
jgi:prevent-host-death family protein